MSRKKKNPALLWQIFTNMWINKNSCFLWISTYKPWYTRTESLHALFQQEWVKYKFWDTYHKNYIYRYIKTVWFAIKNIQHTDVFFIHFRWYEIFFPIYILAKLFWKKIVFDHFVSTRDTLCNDRKKFKPDGIIGKALHFFDIKLIQLSDYTLLDTKTHKDYFVKEFLWGKENNKVWYIYVWCNTELFYPQETKKDSEKYRVFRYGTVLPLQGLEVILQAAKLCELDSNIEFVLVWPAYKAYTNLIKNLELSNTIFIDRVPYKELANEIRKSDICLWWHFSTIKKATRVIAWKSYQFIECGIPTILWENKANKELYSDHKNIHWVEMWSPKKLSDLIINIYKHS